MDKVAQRRGITNRIRETLSPSQLLESFDSEFREFMDKLRELDDYIRLSAIDNKKTLDKTKSQFKSKDYLLCYAHLVSFFEKNQELVLKLQDLNQEVNLDHIKLLEKDISEEELKLLQEKIDNLKFSSAKNSLKKNAGIFDLFKIDIKDLLSSRYWISKLLEDRFSSKDFIVFTKGLKDTIYQANRLQDTLKNVLKPMSSARAKRNPKEYFTFANVYIKEFQLFKNSFVKFYSSGASKILNDISQLKQQEQDVRKEEELARIERIQGPFAKIKPLSEEDLMVNKPPKLVDFPTESRKALDKIKEQEKKEDLPFDLVSKIDEKAANIEFIKIIKEASESNNIKLMFNQILKHSELIENVNSEVSDKLLIIAENIYKFAEEGNEEENDDDWFNKLPNKLPGIPKENEIPEGHIEEAYSDVDFLKNITVDRITSSAQSVVHCFNIFTRNLDKKVPGFKKSKEFNSNFVSALKNAITKGLVVRADKPTESENDRIVIFFTKINLKNLDTNLNGYATLYIECRYLDKNKSLSLKNIQKNFKVS